MDNLNFTGDFMPKEQAWLIAQNASGMINQVKALAKAMDLTYKFIPISLRSPWNYFPPGFYPLANYAIKNNHDFNPKICPKIVITCGKRSVYASLALKGKLGKKITTIHIQDPKISSKYFDFVLAPQHDPICGDNVIKTKFAINHITKPLLDDAASIYPNDFQSFKRPLILTVLGGKNSHFNFDLKSISDMNKTIDKICHSLQANAIMLFSRRTPLEIKKFCHSHFSTNPLVTVWDEKQENPYLALLKHSDYVFLTCDSYSMISEALTAQKKTYVHLLPEKKRKSRLQSFINHSIKQRFISPLCFPLLTNRKITISETDMAAKTLLAKLS